MENKSDSRAALAMAATKKWKDDLGKTNNETTTRQETCLVDSIQASNSRFRIENKGQVLDKEYKKLQPGYVSGRKFGVKEHSMLEEISIEL